MGIELIGCEEVDAVIGDCRQPLVVEIGVTEGAAAALARPLLSAVARRFGDCVRFIKVDANEQGSEVRARFGLRRVPGILVYHRGQLCGRYHHESREQEVVACVARAVERCVPVALYFDRGVRLLAEDISTLRFRLHNLDEGAVQRVQMTVQAPLLFGEVDPYSADIGPGEAEHFGVTVELRRSSRAGVDVPVELQGASESGAPWRARGTLHIVVGRDTVAAGPTTNVRIDGDVFAAESVDFHPVSGGPSGPVPASPEWVLIELRRPLPPRPRRHEEADTPLAPGLPTRVAKVKFLACLADEYRRFLSQYDRTTLLEGVRPGRLHAGRPHDQWQSVSAGRKSEVEAASFAEAEDGVYRLELFARGEGRFCAIAYEKRGGSFVAHWCTNDPEYAGYARRHHDVVWQDK